MAHVLTLSGWRNRVSSQSIVRSQERTIVSTAKYSLTTEKLAGNALLKHQPRNLQPCNFNVSQRWLLSVSVEFAFKRVSSFCVFILSLLSWRRYRRLLGASQRFYSRHCRCYTVNASSWLHSPWYKSVIPLCVGIHGIYTPRGLRALGV